MNWYAYICATCRLRLIKMILPFFSRVSLMKNGSRFAQAVRMAFRLGAGPWRTVRRPVRTTGWSKVGKFDGQRLASADPWPEA